MLGYSVLNQWRPLLGTCVWLDTQQGLGPVLQGTVPEQVQAAALPEHRTHALIDHHKAVLFGSTQQLLLRRLNGLR